jgi:hypothetical protein
MSARCHESGIERMVDPLLSGLVSRADGTLERVLGALNSYLESGEKLLAYAGCRPPKGGKPTRSPTSGHSHLPITTLLWPSAASTRASTSYCSPPEG